ncbi:hypothetical protein DSUL_150004 [Desulfovibrionales bacterium]
MIGREGSLKFYNPAIAKDYTEKKEGRFKLDILITGGDSGGGRKRSLALTWIVSIKKYYSIILTHNLGTLWSLR